MDCFYGDALKLLFAVCDLRSAIRLAAACKRFRRVFWRWIAKSCVAICDACYDWREYRSILPPSRADDFRIASTCPCGAIGWVECWMCERSLPCILAKKVGGGAFGYSCIYPCAIECNTCFIAAEQDTIKYFSVTSRGLVCSYCCSCVPCQRKCNCSKEPDFPCSVCQPCKEIHAPVDLGRVAWYLWKELDIGRRSAEENNEYNPCRAIEYYNTAKAMLAVYDPHNPNLALLDVLAR